MKHTLLLTLLPVLALTGCPADPLPTPEVPDLPSLDAEPPPDGRMPDAAPPDERIIDATPIDRAIDAAPVTDFGDLPDLPDPAVPPALDDTAVLVGRLDTWVGWIIAQRLFAVRIDTLTAAEPGVEDGADGGLPMMGRAQPIAGLPAFADRLIGVRTPNGRPWVLIPDGGGGMLRAHDLSEGVRPKPLQLWPPVRTAISGESILLVGHSSAEPGARIATVRLEDDGPLAPVLDRQGITLPVAVAPGLSGWAFAFADGICQSFLPTADAARDPAPGNIWRCASRPDITLIGDTRRLYAVGDVAGNLRAWTAMPGAAQAPTEAPLDGDPRDITLALGASAEVLHPIPGGQALRVEDADGVTIQLLTADQTRVLPAPADGVVFGASRFFQSRFLVIWDPDLGQPILRSVEAVEGPPPPVDALQCRPLPELCDDQDDFVDLDCVNGRENARCCRERAEGNLEVTALNISSDDPALVDIPNLPWFMAQTPAGPVMIVAYDDRLDLLRLRTGSPIDNDSADVRIARFDGIHRIERFGQQLTQLVIHGHRAGTPGGGETPDAGPADDAGLDAALDAGPDADVAPAEVPVLAWYLGRRILEDGSSQVLTYESAPPCAPVMHLTMRDGMARVFCADRAMDVPFDQDGPRLAEATPVPYPAGDVRWIGPYVAEQIGQRFLAATGDDHTLHVWRDTPDGDPIVDDPLPERLADLVPEDRTLPIRLPENDNVHLARIRGATLQVHLPDIGWTPGPSTRWPERASFSTTDPMALTLAEVTDPEVPNYNRENRRYIVTLHSLERDALHWGQVVVIDEGAELRGIYMNGVRFADYDAGDPLLWYGFGERRTINVRPRGVLCNPAVPMQ